jgi:hypothetical protein
MDNLPPLLRYLMGGLLLGLGGLMLVWHQGPNRWIGVRLPWTLADREIWDRSWRLAAVFLLGMGVGALISPKVLFISLAHLVILGLGYPVVLYRRKYGTLRFWKDSGWLDYRPVARCRHCGHFQKLEDAAALETAACEVCHTPVHF